ncbi:hypothetical protein KR51_00031300 [Rubidibacter lacunae KORDI 51-2]|uniref:Uncharacterized protein n=1 Tax=Rubidibacter lacunae KORDI 51-2 TaxID=582515 RepID=U5D6C4_9CHRO|nr:hypothetical protein KR51_00031300 [Rubidibacter lacunae KORDI 51-2]
MLRQQLQRSRTHVPNCIQYASFVMFIYGADALGMQDTVNIMPKRTIRMHLKPLATLVLSAGL